MRLEASGPRSDPFRWFENLLILLDGFLIEETTKKANFQIGGFPWSVWPETLHVLYG